MNVFENDGYTVVTVEKIFDIYLHVADSGEKIEKRRKTKEERDKTLSRIFF